MTLRTGYGPAHPEFEAFLMAEIGDDPNGLPLTVLSALARQDRDPESEALRLRGLSREAAIAGMADLIKALPAGSWSDLDAREIAAGLLAHLPDGRTPAQAAPTVGADLGTRYGSTAIRLLLCTGFAAMVAFAIWRMQGDTTNYMDLSALQSDGAPTLAAATAPPTVSHGRPERFRSDLHQTGPEKLLAYKMIERRSAPVQAHDAREATTDMARDAAS